MAYSKEERAAYSREWWKKNKGRCKEYRRRYRELNRDKMRKRERRYLREKMPTVTRYGITVEEFRGMRTKQRHRCAICRGKPKQGARLFIDHLHSTNKIRGLLCCGCNTKLAWFERNETAILKYLSQHGREKLAV